jgi:hypothetical protein
MSEPDLQAQIAAAKAYEEFFVPGLFGEWAPRVAAAAQLQTGNHVLDVARVAQGCSRGKPRRGWARAASSLAWTQALACWRWPPSLRPGSNGAKEQRRLFLGRISGSTPW